MDSAWILCKWIKRGRGAGKTTHLHSLASPWALPPMCSSQFVAPVLWFQGLWRDCIGILWCWPPDALMRFCSHWNDQTSICVNLQSGRRRINQTRVRRKVKGALRDRPERIERVPGVRARLCAGHSFCFLKIKEHSSQRRQGESHWLNISLADKDVWWNSRPSRKWTNQLEKSFAVKRGLCWTQQ